MYIINLSYGDHTPSDYVDRLRVDKIRPSSIGQCRNWMKSNKIDLWNSMVTMVSWSFMNPHHQVFSPPPCRRREPSRPSQTQNLVVPLGPAKMRVLNWWSNKKTIIPETKWWSHARFGCDKVIVIHEIETIQLDPTCTLLDSACQSKQVPSVYPYRKCPWSSFRRSVRPVVESKGSNHSQFSSTINPAKSNKPIYV